MMNAKAQAWGFDLFIAAIIFVGGIIFFYLYTLNASSDQEALPELIAEADMLATILLSEGVPPTWNTTTLSQIGLLTNNKINETKLESFYNLSIQDYKKTKAITRLRYDYYITFSEQITINGQQLNGIGLTPNTPNHLAKLSRLTIYKNKPISITVEVWA